MVEGQSMALKMQIFTYFILKEKTKKLPLYVFQALMMSSKNPLNLIH